MNSNNSREIKEKKISKLFDRYLSNLSGEYKKNCEDIRKKTIKENELNSALKKTISNFKRNKKHILAISISGFAGVGKTFSLDSIEKISRDLQVKSRVIEMDAFLGTSRGSKERKNMPETWENFKNNFYDHDKLQAYIDNILNSEYGETVKEEGVYNRENNGKLDGEVEFEIPREKFILIIEGVNATEYLEHAEKTKEYVDTLNVVVFDDPAESFLRAIFRDVNSKNVGLRDRIIFRLKEYSQMWKFILNNLRDSDIVVLKNNISDVTNSLLAEFMDKSGQTKEMVLSKIKEGEEEFEKQKFTKNNKFSIKSVKIKKYLRTLESWINKKISS